MKLFTKIQFDQLLENGSPNNREKDHKPVVKLFLPGSGCTWLLTEIEPEDHELAFGLCDLGMGFPELGYVDLKEISRVKSKLGLYIERDLHFDGKFPISVYSDAARANDYITDDETVLARYCIKKVPGYEPQ